MKDEIKEILDKLKDSVNYPMIDVPTMDGTDSEPMENTVLLEPNESKLLLDFLTNLQQIEQDHQRINGELREENKKLQEENERLKEECKEWKENHKAVCIQRDNILDNIVKNTEERIDYKSRNENAINKIQYIIDYGFDYDGFNTVESLKGLIDMLVDYARQSKDILQGDDKDVKD